MLLAQNLNSIQSQGLGGGVPSDVAGIINNAVPFIFGAAGMLLLVYLVLGGLQMMTSKGDPKAMQGAQGKISNALIGFLIVIVAYAVVSILGTALHINAFGDIFGSK
ncbi:MAG TPA: hypothetical protein VFI61_00050 [Patescibacteria group bacterium]|nr:hypothetical protein [Patescibacteria group bacterium]